ncbi:hypothetical protein B0H14DRAFT_3505920 [Mycena olivaceomarginata]|nr:hypothetical protein B0H14DRAFT_3505920 [Mycena olivaceomarginata]
MDYVNYDKLRGKYAVELTGNVPRSRPATWNVDTLRLVRDGLMDGTIDFVPMTPAQVKEAGCRAEGAGGKKSRAVGSEEDSSSEEEDDDDDDSSDKEPAVRPTPRSGRMHAVMAAGAGSPLPPTPASVGLRAAPPLQQHAPLPWARASGA